MSFKVLKQKINKEITIDIKIQKTNLIINKQQQFKTYNNEKSNYDFSSRFDISNHVRSKHRR